MWEAISHSEESKIIEDKRYVVEEIKKEWFVDSIFFEMFDTARDFLEVHVSLWSINKSYKGNFTIHQKFYVLYY